MLEVDIGVRLGDFQLEPRFTTDDAPITALFGRSGAGKSSIIAAIAGLLQPGNGRIVLDGDTLFDAQTRVNRAAPRRRVGVVFQDSRLFPHYSVRDNLLYGWRRASGPRPLDLAAVVEPLGVAQLLERRPATLSGGERQRVAIGRALLANPRLILMDEPLASLDGERKAELLPLIAQLPSQFKIPVVYVSHTIDEVLRLADRMVLLDRGRVLASGSVEEVANRSDFVQIAAIEGGPDAFTVISATVIDHNAREGQTHLSFGGGTLAVPRLAGEPGERVRLRVAAGEVILALDRPSGISVRNVIPARIVAITEAGPMLDVTLDAGGPLRARISRAARDELSLVPDKQVFALIKSAALAGGIGRRNAGE